MSEWISTRVGAGRASWQWPVWLFFMGGSGRHRSLIGQRPKGSESSQRHGEGE